MNEGQTRLQEARVLEEFLGWLHESGSYIGYRGSSKPDLTEFTRPQSVFMIQSFLMRDDEEPND